MQYIQELHHTEPWNLCTESVMELGKGCHLFHLVSIGALPYEPVGNPTKNSIVKNHIRNKGRADNGNFQLEWLVRLSCYQGILGALSHSYIISATDEIRKNILLVRRTSATGTSTK